MNALIKYPGAKWKFAEKIIEMMPEHHSYLEPYFGSGAVLFNKQPSHIETVNDIDDEVVNLFYCIRTDPERLARLLYLTPYARQEYENAYIKTDEPLEKARRFCIRLNQGHGFRTTGEKVGWKNDLQGRERAYCKVDWNKLPEKIVQTAERLKDVQIESRPAVDVIKRFNFDNVLIYADPPYLLSTRCREQYNHEMSEEQHIELLDVLLRHKGYVMISGYDSDLYNDMLKGWYKTEQDFYTQNNQQRTDYLWMNFHPYGQLSL